MDAVLPRPPCPVLAELLAVVAELERLEAERRGSDGEVNAIVY